MYDLAPYWPILPFLIGILVALDRTLVQILLYSLGALVIGIGVALLSEPRSHIISRYQFEMIRFTLYLFIFGLFTPRLLRFLWNLVRR